MEFAKVALALVPIAMALPPSALLPVPIAMLLFVVELRPAFELAPSAVFAEPVTVALGLEFPAFAFVPIAVFSFPGMTPAAIAPEPQAVLFVPGDGSACMLLSFPER
jgi:hypothetical protein